MKLTRWFVMFVGRVSLLLSVGALLSCFGTAAIAAPTANAYVRVVHAAAGARNVDVFVDGKELLRNFAFSTVSSYVPLPAGTHIIKVAPTGKGSGAAVITQSVSVLSGTPYTLAALGTAASGFSLTAFVDNNVRTAGRARVRVYHLSTNAGPVNVVSTNAGPVNAATGGRTVITGLSYPTASDYLTVAPGAYTFNVTATKANATVPVSATLASGTIASIFAIGMYKGTPALKFVVASVPGIAHTMRTGSRIALASVLKV